MTTPDESKEFTELQFQFIFGACVGLSNQKIAEQCEISEEIVATTMRSVFAKAGLGTRVELVMFARAALNAYPRRNSGR